MRWTFIIDIRDFKVDINLEMTIMKKETCDEDRRRLIQAYEEGTSIAKAASVLKIKRTTAYGIVYRYRTENRIQKHLRGGARNKKLTQEQRNSIRGFLDEDSTLSLRALRDRAYRELGVEVCEKTIDRCLDDFHYTLKRLHCLPAQRNSIEVVEKRAIYARDFMNLLSIIPGDRIFFLDEVGFSVSMRSRYGRSTRGRIASMVVPALRTRNFSCCSAMSKDGMLHYRVETRPFNTGRMIAFLEELCQQLESIGKRECVFILDNVAFHRSSQVREFIEGAQHTIMFLPPYSPFLNPIENCFSKWKRFVRTSNSHNEAELITSIERGFGTISGEDCAGFYRHMIGFLPRCLGRENIVDE
jgi:transposase